MLMPTLCQTEELIQILNVNVIALVGRVPKCLKSCSNILTHIGACPNTHESLVYYAQSSLEDGLK